MYKSRFLKMVLMILLGMVLFLGVTVLKAEDKIEKGRSLFLSKGCRACHIIQGLKGTEGKGTDLTDVGSRLSSKAIKKKIKVCMPKLDISKKDVETLAAYLSTLKSTTKAQPALTTVDIKWKGKVTEGALVKIVNLLINNKGKEIELAGKKQRITGKEILDVKITVLDCCLQEEFQDVIRKVSTYAKVKNSDFPSIHASVSADDIPKIDKIGIIMDIRLEPEAHDLWMKAISQ